MTGSQYQEHKRRFKSQKKSSKCKHSTRISPCACWRTRVRSGQIMPERIVPEDTRSTTDAAKLNTTHKPPNATLSEEYPRGEGSSTNGGQEPTTITAPCVRTPTPNSILQQRTQIITSSNAIPEHIATGDSWSQQRLSERQRNGSRRDNTPTAKH